MTADTFLQYSSNILMRLFILFMKYKSLSSDEWPGEKSFFNNSIISLNDLVLNEVQVERDLVWAGFK